MKQIVVGIFLLGAFVFIALFGYTRQSSLFPGQLPQSVLVKAECLVNFQGRHSVIECQTKGLQQACRKHPKYVCPKDFIQKVFVSRSVGKQFIAHITPTSFVSVRLHISKQNNPKIVQIIVEGREFLPSKVKRK